MFDRKLVIKTESMKFDRWGDLTGRYVLMKRSTWVALWEMIQHFWSFTHTHPTSWQGNTKMLFWMDEMFLLFSGLTSARVWFTKLAPPVMVLSYCGSDWFVNLWSAVIDTWFIQSPAKYFLKVPALSQTVLSVPFLYITLVSNSIHLLLAPFLVSTISWRKSRPLQLLNAWLFLWFYFFASENDAAETDESKSTGWKTKTMSWGMRMNLCRTEWKCRISDNCFLVCLYKRALSYQLGHLIHWWYKKKNYWL